MSNKRREKQKKLVRKHVKRPKVKQREKQKKLVSKNVKRLKMQKRGKKKKKLLRKQVKRYESKRKVDEEVTAKAKAEEEAIKKAVEEDAIKKAAALEAKAAEEHAIKKANNDENVDETADVNQTDNEKDVEETDDVEQVLKKIPTMPFLNTSTRSKKKEADKEGFYKGNKATRQKVHDILGIPMGKRKLEDLEQRPFNNPFIVEWEAQYSHLRKPTPPVIGLQISSTHKADFMFKMNFITLFGSTMGKLENGGRVPTKLLKCIKEDDDISDIDWCGYILIACTLKLEHSDDEEKDNDGNKKKMLGESRTSWRFRPYRRADWYEHVALISTCHRITVAAVRSLHEWVSRIQENLLDRVSQLHKPFSLPECLKADNTIRVNRISQVTYRRACLMLALEGFPLSL
ncbi:hypothetical protein Tco_0448915 [Tanacetum coccineum]